MVDRVIFYKYECGSFQSIYILLQHNTTPTLCGQKHNFHRICECTWLAAHPACSACPCIRQNFLLRCKHIAVHPSTRLFANVSSNHLSTMSIETENGNFYTISCEKYEYLNWKIPCEKWWGHWVTLCNSFCNVWLRIWNSAGLMCVCGRIGCWRVTYMGFVLCTNGCEWKTDKCGGTQTPH